ncbi:MAG: ferredoxin--NADP reductase [Pseudomonadota bacterium]
MGFHTESVLDVTHWNETLFSFRTTRANSFRFENGHFVMIGLRVNNKPLMRAYSIASANYDEYLEFLSIKVPNGPLTSRLKNIKPGDEILMSAKPVGTLIISDLSPAPHLFLLATGTGLAPFMSIIRDPETYERFEKVILVHGVRFVSELAYRERLEAKMADDEWLGEIMAKQFIYYPTVTREPFRNEGRLTDLITSGKLAADLGIDQLNPETDRAMVCGSPQMLVDTTAILDNLGLRASKRIGDVADYVIERAFVEPR